MLNRVCMFNRAACSIAVTRHFWSKLIVVGVSDPLKHPAGRLAFGTAHERLVREDPTTPDINDRLKCSRYGQLELRWRLAEAAPSGLSHELGLTKGISDWREKRTASADHF